MNSKSFFKTLIMLLGVVLIILLGINVIVIAQDIGEALFETELTGDTIREPVPCGLGYISIHSHEFRG